MSDVEEAAPPPAARSYSVPHRVLPDLLAPDETARLLAHAAANEARFKPTLVGG